MSAVRAVARGESWLSPAVDSQVVRHAVEQPSPGSPVPPSLSPSPHARYKCSVCSRRTGAGPAADLVVVNVMLPGINGLEGTPRLKALAPSLRVILVSAHRDRTELFRVAATEAGAEAFIPKDDLDLKVVQTWKGSYQRKG